MAHRAPILRGAWLTARGLASAVSSILGGRPAPGRLPDAARALPVAVAGLVLGISIVSAAPTVGAGKGDGSGIEHARIAVGGGLVAGQSDQGDPPRDATPSSAPFVDVTSRTGDARQASVDPTVDPLRDPARLPAPPLQGQASTLSPTAMLPDATLLKPVVIDTSVPSSAAPVRAYVVRAGDTPASIAARFRVSVLTVRWANGLGALDVLPTGRRLLIPSVSGLLVTVGEGDTLESISRSSGVPVERIVTFNGLTDRSLVLGQVLTVPGGHGPAIATPKPAAPSAAARAPRATAKASATAKVSVRHGAAPSSGPVAAAATPGKLLWPVPGGRISQAFGCTGFYLEPRNGSCAHFHFGVDIWASSGTPALAAAAGTIVFAGWRSDAGDNEVWIDVGNDLTIGYHHLSSVAVAAGQSVARGERVGRVGMTGLATGPHLHFEVWIGPVRVGYRVDPMPYF